MWLSRPGPFGLFGERRALGVAKATFLPTKPATHRQFQAAADIERDPVRTDRERRPAVAAGSHLHLRVHRHLPTEALQPLEAPLEIGADTSA
jgi:hypothetical protein